MQSLKGWLGQGLGCKGYGFLIALQEFQGKRGYREAQHSAPAMSAQGQEPWGAAGAQRTPRKAHQEGRWPDAGSPGTPRKAPVITIDDSDDEAHGWPAHARPQQQVAAAPPHAGGPVLAPRRFFINLLDDEEDSGLAGGAQQHAHASPAHAHQRQRPGCQRVQRALGPAHLDPAVASPQGRVPQAFVVSLLDSSSDDDDEGFQPLTPPLAQERAAGTQAQQHHQQQQQQRAQADPARPPGHAQAAAMGASHAEEPEETRQPQGHRQGQGPAPMQRQGLQLHEGGEPGQRQVRQRVDALLRGVGVGLDLPQQKAVKPKRGPSQQGTLQQGPLPQGPQARRVRQRLGEGLDREPQQDWCEHLEPQQHQALHRRPQQQPQQQPRHPQQQNQPQRHQPAQQPPPAQQHQEQRQQQGQQRRAQPRSLTPGPEQAQAAQQAQHQPQPCHSSCQGYQTNGMLIANYKRTNNSVHKMDKGFLGILNSLRGWDQYLALKPGSWVLGANLGKGFFGRKKLRCVGCDTTATKDHQPLLLSVTATEIVLTYRPTPTAQLVTEPHTQLSIEYACSLACAKKVSGDGVMAAQQPSLRDTRIVPELRGMSLHLPGPGQDLLVAPYLVQCLEGFVEGQGKEAERPKWRKLFKQALGAGGWHGTLPMLTEEFRVLLEML